MILPTFNIPLILCFVYVGSFGWAARPNQDDNQGGMVREDADAIDGNGRTLFHHACMSNDLESVYTLLTQNTQINLPDFTGMTCLHYACKLGFVQLVQVLLDNKADLKPKDKDGKTCLYHACQQGHVKIARLLLENDADLREAAKDGTTPLDMGIRLHNPSMASLMELYMNAEKKTTAPCTPTVELPPRHVLNRHNKRGMSPLHLECQNGSIIKVLLMLSMGANINLPSVDGLVPLHYACKSGDSALADMLIRHGALINVVDPQGQPPLFHACLNAHIKVVEALLKHKPDVLLFDCHGRSILIAACISNNYAVFSLIMSHLHTTLSSSRNELLKYLINLQDVHGMSPLHYAYEKENFNIAKDLLLNGAKINLYNHQKKIPSELASVKFQGEIGKFMFGAKL